jgi:hypothetical protein
LAARHDSVLDGESGSAHGAPTALGISVHLEAAHATVGGVGTVIRSQADIESTFNVGVLGMGVAAVVEGIFNPVTHQRPKRDAPARC